MRRLLPSKRLASGFDNARHPTSDSFIDEAGLNSQFDSSGTPTFPPSSIQPLRLSVPDRAPSKPHRATPTANTSLPQTSPISPAETTRNSSARRPPKHPTGFFVSPDLDLPRAKPPKPLLPKKGSDTSKKPFQRSTQSLVSDVVLDISAQPMNQTESSSLPKTSSYQSTSAGPLADSVLNVSSTTLTSENDPTLLPQSGTAESMDSMSHSIPSTLTPPQPVKYHVVNRPDSIAETLPPAYEEVDPETPLSPSYPHSNTVGMHPSIVEKSFPNHQSRASFAHPPRPAPAMGRPRADTGTRRPLPLKPAPQTSGGDLDKVRLRPNSRAPPPAQRTWETSYSYAVHAQGEESDELADDDAYTVEEILDEFRDLRLSSATPHFLATAERPDSIYSVSSHSFSPDDRLFSMIPSRNTA